jgi:hypothetical protein
MFARIHVLKFQNKVAKDSLKNTCRLINDKLLKRGLYSSTFVMLMTQTFMSSTHGKMKKPQTKLIHNTLIL